MARRKKKKVSTIYVVSLAAHLAVGAVLALIPQKKLREVVAIALNEAPKREEKKAEPPKPQEHKAERPARAPTHVAHSTAAPQPSTASAAAQAPAFTDLGLTLDSSASDGLAVRIQAPVAPVVAKPIALVTKPKVLMPKLESACLEDVVKARPLELVRPTYTEEARRARVQGRVRMELTVDDHGVVTDARIVDGLGYGLDEAALAAARRLRFTPASQCKRAVTAPFILAMRFVLET